MDKVSSAKYNAIVEIKFFLIFVLAFEPFEKIKLI
jgi:hypothetical protein